MGNNLPNHPSRRMAGEPESLQQLIGGCRRMADRWTAAARRAAAAEHSAAPAAAALHGVTVPPASAHVVDGMADYGDRAFPPRRNGPGPGREPDALPPRHIGI